MNSFSQYGEDKEITKYFAGETGTFLDFGANDGIKFSNTWRLANAGWSGVAVEADPINIEKLKINYNSFEHLKIEASAISDKDGEIDFYVTTKDQIHNSTNLLSTTELSQVKLWTSNKVEFKKIRVPSISIKTFRKKYEDMLFDFINLDVEGNNLKILKEMNLKDMGCSCICVEHEGAYLNVMDYCGKFGLNDILLLNNVNIILAK